MILLLSIMLKAQMDQTAQRFASTITAEDLSNQSARLQTLMSRFHLAGEGSAARPAAQLRRTSPDGEFAPPTRRRAQVETA